MTTIWEAEVAIAIFGSTARGDADIISDADLLIVSDSSDIAVELKKALDALGWSCSAFTWERLERSSISGSLFIQHLKDEAQIVNDPNGRLSALLENFRPLPDYRDVVDESLRLLLLLEAIPQSRLGLLWALDVLAVSVRGASIAALASEGIYAFSQTDLNRGLVRIELMSEREARILPSLRRYKRMYRGGQCNERLSLELVEDAADLVDGVFRLGFHIHAVDQTVAIDAAIRAGGNTSEHESWYGVCRRIESALLDLRPAGPGVADELKQRTRKLERMVRSPSEYGGYISSHIPALAKEVEAIAGLAAI